jgi:hypothetical protein
MYLRMHQALQYYAPGKDDLARQVWMILESNCVSHPEAGCVRHSDEQYSTYVLERKTTASKSRGTLSTDTAGH